MTVPPPPVPINKPENVRKAEEFLGFATPYEQECIGGCGKIIQSWQFSKFKNKGSGPGWVATICEDCEVVRNAKIAQEDRMKVINELIDNSDVPPNYHTWVPEIAERKGNTQLLTHVGHNKKNSYYIWGSNGVGKSHAVGYAGYRMCSNFTSVKFYIASRWLDGLMMAKREQRIDSMVREALVCDILILDDFDKINITDAKAEQLNHIVDTREKDGKHIWMTANIPMPEMQSRLGDIYGSSIFTRLERMVGNNIIQLKHVKESKG